MDQTLEQSLAGNRHVKVSTLAKALNINLHSFYKAVRSGEVKSVRVGANIRIPAFEARRLLGLEEGE